MSVVADLEAGLQAMLNLKPPGVSGSRIGSITTLCVNNVQSESVLIQKIYTHFKKTPGTHKLGVLYVVDSVTRKWLEQAKAQGQPINSAAQDGTFAAGVHRVAELMPVLMNDILSTAPEDQKEKIRKLVDIWEKGQTFPAAMLESFKQRLNAPRPPVLSSTTPPGSPPANLGSAMAGSSKPAAAAANIPNIMQTLANLARQNNAANSGAAPAAPPSNPSLTAPPGSAAPYGLPAGAQAGNSILQALQNHAAQGTPGMGLPFVAPSQPQQQQQQQQPQAAPPPVNFPAGLPFAMLSGFQQAPPQAAAAIPPLNGTNMPANGFANGGQAALPSAAPAVDPNVQQQLLLIQTLAQQGVPVETITAIVAQMAAGNNAPPAVPPPQPVNQMPAPAASGTYLPGGGVADQRWDGQGRPDASRDRDAFGRDPVRSPNRFRGRSRSRSPGRRWEGNDRGNYEYGRNNNNTTPPGGRRGGFDDRDSGGDRERDHGRGRDQAYRQRSPPGAGRRSPGDDGPPAQGEKWVQYDSSLPNGHIKVFSRTLFVGGVTCSEAELRGIFSRHGAVQTCIVNREKRHAFVKMYFRKDAVAAKEAMEEARSHDVSLRTRWGVGFGPRDCSDYATGISVIPIAKLTEADRKWMLTAEFGGSGGAAIVSGMCVEEPDIEIGAGVSSKAISRRMQTDKGGQNGPKSTHRRHDDEEVGVNQQQLGQGAGAAGGRWRRGREGGRDGGRRDGGGGGEQQQQNPQQQQQQQQQQQHRGGGGGDKTAGGANINKGGDQPVVPDFPFGLTIGPNGMPIFPPGFSFPAPDAQQH